MSESMKIRNLKNYGIPSHIVNIWEKDYPPYLLPLQEEAVRNYGVLDYGEGITGLPRRYTPRNDNISPSPYPLPSRERGKKNINNNLLVIAPNSSGKTFIGEMAAIAQAIHLQKTIYLAPLRALADEKIGILKISTVIVESIWSSLPATVEKMTII